MQNPLKEKVAKCQQICGTHVSLCDPTITELFSYARYDFIWIDTEHSAIDYSTLLNHLNAAQVGGTPAIVRVHMHDFNHVKRVLEMGPQGVIFPMINTAEEADIAMKSCMYPPLGNRGFGPLRANRYGFDDADEYIARSNDLLCRFIQIETAEAVKNLPEIVKNPYIDGYIFGPCDLSGSIGRLNDVFCGEVTDLIKEAVDVIRGVGKCIGVSTGSDDPAVIQHWYDLGINMISAGVDNSYLLRSAIRNRENIQKMFAADK